MTTFAVELDYEVAPTPTSAPYLCAVCRKGLPGDGPFLRIGQNTFGQGSLWLCSDHTELALRANRLMSLRLYEERAAHDQAEFTAKSAALDAERSRLLDVEAREAAAVEQASEALKRAEQAEATAAEAKQQVHDLGRLLDEQTKRAEQAEAGSSTVHLWNERCARLEAIVAENAGTPARKTKASS